MFGQKEESVCIETVGDKREFDKIKKTLKTPDKAKSRRDKAKSVDFTKKKKEETSTPAKKSKSLRRAEDRVKRMFLKLGDIIELEGIKTKDFAENPHQGEIITEYTTTHTPRHSHLLSVYEGRSECTSVPKKCQKKDRFSDLSEDFSDSFCRIFLT